MELQVLTKLSKVSHFLRYYWLSVISRAFQVLSDPDKRALFDQHGEDPDSRTPGMASPFAGMRTYGGGGGMRGDELTPDDLFNMFFGGGGFSGGGFNAGSISLETCTQNRTIWRSIRRARDTSTYIWCWTTSTATSATCSTTSKLVSLLPTSSCSHITRFHNYTNSIRRTIGGRENPFICIWRSPTPLYWSTYHPSTFDTILCKSFRYIIVEYFQITATRSKSWNYICERSTGSMSIGIRTTTTEISRCPRMVRSG